jgi:hypothetical protein
MRDPVMPSPGRGKWITLALLAALAALMYVSIMIQANEVRVLTQ